MRRKVRDNIRDWFNETHLMRFINIFRDSMWPDGKPKTPGIPRTTEEKIRTRDEANRKLSSLVPGAYFLELDFRNSCLDTRIIDLAANVIGRSNARRGARRMFAVLQNRRLNQHIAYTIVDEVRIPPHVAGN